MKKTPVQLVGALVALLSSVSMGIAQASTETPAALEPDPIAGRVLHVYVDPDFGDDVAGRADLEARLAAQVPFNNIPIPFKTINGHTEANSTSPARDLGAIPSLVVNGTALDGEGFTHFVVHALPGLYGPLDDNEDPCHPPSGQSWNDDVFPILMWDRISIQGTSILDTILDMRTDVVPSSIASGSAVIFQGTWNRMNSLSFKLPNGPDRNADWYVYHGAYQDPQQREYYARTFIDGVTIRGADVPRGNSAFGFLLDSPAAGVFIHAEYDPIRPTVSNCAITDNCAGVVVMNRWFNRDGVMGFLRQRPTLQNNTIARNRVGMIDTDNASRYPASAPFLLRRSLGTYVNNVFTNDWWDLVGIDAELVRYDQRWNGTTYVPFTQNGGYVNAFSDPCVFPSTVPSRVNPALSPPHGRCWPGSIVAMGLLPGQSAPFLGAAVNRLELDTWTASPGNTDLYLHERLQTLGAAVVSPGNLRTQHDVRTVPYLPHSAPSPLVSSALATSYPGMFQNPLFAQGIGPGSGSFRRLIFDGTAYVADTPYRPLRYILNLRDTTTIAGQTVSTLCSGFDNDGEGFFNEREYATYYFPTSTVGSVDLGADEIGIFIVGGYQALSRTILHVFDLPSNSIIPQDVFAFGEPGFVGLIDSQVPGFGMFQNPYLVKDILFPNCLNAPSVVQGPPFYTFAGLASGSLHTPFMPSLFPDLHLVLGSGSIHDTTLTALNTQLWHIAPPLPPAPTVSTTPGVAANQLLTPPTTQFDPQGVWLYRHPASLMSTPFDQTRFTYTFWASGANFNWQTHLIQGRLVP